MKKSFSAATTPLLVLLNLSGLKCEDLGERSQCIWSLSPNAAKLPDPLLLITSSWLPPEWHHLLSTHLTTPFSSLSQWRPLHHPSHLDQSLHRPHFSSSLLRGKTSYSLISALIITQSLAVFLPGSDCQI